MGPDELSPIDACNFKRLAFQLERICMVPPDSENESPTKMRTIPSLTSLNESEILAFANASTIEKFATGSMIITEGEYDGALYYLISGEVEIKKRGRRLLLLHQTGDIFGEMNAIDRSIRSASAQALKPSICLKIDAAFFDPISQSDRHTFRYLLYKGFAEALAKRLHSTTDKYLRALNQIAKLKSALTKIQRENSNF
jgi:CRP/FNR family cyclic AMP-dependent transcriptional regulator